MSGPENVRVLGPLTEWATRVFDDVELTPEDRTVVGKLSQSADSRLQIEELRQGLRVRTRSWVGVVRLPTVEIRIVPKVTGDKLGLVRLVEYATGLDALTRLGDGATLDASSDSLLELFIILFVEASERVLRRGPAVRLCRTRGRPADCAWPDSRRPAGAQTIRPARPHRLPLRRVGTRCRREPTADRSHADRFSAGKLRRTAAPHLAASERARTNLQYRSTRPCTCPSDLDLQPAERALRDSPSVGMAAVRRYGHR